MAAVTVRSNQIARSAFRVLGSGIASNEVIRVGGRDVEITHPDKVLFPKPKLTKLQLARHYERVAATMLPYVTGRPVAMESYPGGIGGKGFYLKNVPKHFPEWVERVEVAKRGGTNTQITIENEATLVYLAAQNVITPHIWLSRVDEPREPDRLIIDLDPSPGVTFATIRATAREAGRRLEEAGLVPFAMVTGSRGIHVVCPLRRGHGYSDVHGWARLLAEAMVAADPENLTLEWKRDDRGKRIFVDVNRIAYAQHAVAPYGVRAKPRGPVAMPIHWDELSDAKLKPDRWTIRNAADRLESEGDAWKGMGRRARGLPKKPPAP